MKLSVSILVAAAAAAPSFAALGDVVNSFPAPAENPYGLARGPAYLYVYCYTWGDYIWALEPSSGSVVASFPSPFGVFTRGLSYSPPDYLWIGNSYTLYVYRCAATSGSIYSSWPVEQATKGLAVKGTGDGGVGARAIFTADTTFPELISRRNLTNGSIYASFTTYYFADIAWDWRNRTVWGGYSSIIYGCATNGSLKASFASPSDYPKGMAYYGEYLYIGTYSDDVIWQVHCPPFAAVAPASLGKIKALFR